MKKFLTLLGIVALFTIMFSSCKSHETCPAYGKTTVPNGVEQPI